MSPWIPSGVTLSYAGSQCTNAYGNAATHSRQEGPLTDVAGRLREAVEDALRAGLSQADLAERLGVTQGTISRCKAGAIGDPAASLLGAAARELGLNGHWLLTAQGDKRTVAAGGDRIFAAGVQAGLQQAEEVIRRLRTTAPDASAGEVGHAMHHREDVKKAVEAASPQPGRARRRSRQE